MCNHAHRNIYQKIRFEFVSAKRSLITALLPFLVLFATLTLAAMPVWADSVIATVTVGTSPTKLLAVNPITNKIYVANDFSSNVTVIDGATNSTSTVAAAGTPVAFGVNTVTNKIYVANVGNTVTVIDGATNSTTTIIVGSGPRAFAINTTTNKIYVANYYSSTVTVIDGATNSTTSFAVGCGPRAVAVNPVTNKIYLPNSCGNNVTVIDGATNSTTSVTAGFQPMAIALNPVTNKIYVANYSGGVTVIDGATNSTTSVAAPVLLGAIAVNPVTNKIYAMVVGSLVSTVTVIDGATNTTTTVGVGNTAVAGEQCAIVINPVTNKIYVATSDYWVGVIDGASNSYGAIVAGHSQTAVAINPVTSRIYVTGYQFQAPANIVTVIAPPTLSAIAVTLANPTINVGQTQQFTATGTFSDGTSRALIGGGGMWVGKAPMSTPRYVHAVGVVNGTLYAVGGVNDSGGLATVEAYDPSTNTWTPKASMSTPRWGHAVGMVNGMLYALGGYNSVNGHLATMEAYDPVTNTWSPKASMSTSRYGAAVAVVNGTLYAVGGHHGGSSFATMEAYDPATNTWTTKASMPTPRSSMAVGVVNGTLYAVGGVNDSGHLATAEAYDPVTNTWTTKASMPTGRAVLAAGVVNGMLYAVGGHYAGATVEAYDPATNTWATKASMSTPRSYLAAGVVNGTLYAVGGEGSTTLATVEAYTPPEVIWSSNTSVATINSTGLATGFNAGTTTITATSGSISGSTTLTVLSPTSTLSISKAGTGSGTVSSTPTGISCGADCTEIYNNGTALTLTATPVVGSVFAGWTGGGCSGTGTCTVTINADTSVLATFNVQTFGLTATRAGTGSGTVTSSPAGINCGADCAEVYNYGTVVNLTAVAASGFTFAGWSGDSDCSDGSVTMIASKTCTATFNLVTLTSISVTPANSTINVGQTQQFAATGIFSDGTSRTLTGSGGGTWVGKASMSTARFAPAAGVVNGTLYAVGGHDGSGALATVEAYDSLTNAWMHKASMSTPRDHPAAGVVNGILYAVGGSGLASVEAYDPATNTWTSKRPMSTPRNGHAVGVVNGILYAVGGSGLATVEAYDPIANIWVPKASMSTARAYFAVAVVNGILYAVGGRSGSGFLATVEAYNPVTNTWTYMASMPAPRDVHAAGVVNNTLYAVGGLNNSSSSLTTVDAYDPATNTWTAKASLFTPRHAPAVGVVNGTLYAVGGDNSSGYLATVEAYTPNEVTWNSSNTSVASINLTGLSTGSNPGATTITATSGSISGSTTLTVRDTTPPIVIVPPDMIVEATGPSGSVVTFTASASDLVDGVLVPVCSPASGSTFAIGTTIVTCTATDVAGNSGSTSFSVTVRDTTPPMIAAQADVTAEATSSAGAVVSYTSPSTTDIVDGSGVATCLPVSGTTFVLGNTTVTCSATDAHGNAATPTSFVVHVVDTTAPIVTVPANMTVEASGATGSIVTFTSSATDLVDGTLVPTCTPSSGSTFAIGTATVTCTATDAAGNSGSASFSVTVQDSTPPVIAAHTDVTAEATSAAGAIVTYINPATADAVDGPGVASCLPASGSLFPLGNTTVTCSATDAHGNAAVATSFMVHVADTTAPTITAPANITTEATSAVGAVVNYSPAVATDAVSIPTVTCSPLSGSTFPLGTTTVTCTATDAAGNSSSATFSVTVQDTTPPVISISQLPLANANGWNNSNVTVNFSATDAVSTPMCSVNSVTLTAEGSAQVVSTTCTDAAGNSATASHTVNIDKTAPVVTGTRTPAANADGWNNTDVTAHFTATDGLSGVEGSAAADVVISSEGMGQTASTSFTDLAGNSSSATVSNINIDKAAPVLTMPSLAGSYGFNSSLTLTFAATDALSQIATQSATLNGDPVGSGDTVVLTQLGTNTFVLTATDKAGNSVTETRQFSVNYTFGGFLSPLAGNRTTFHLGSVIPVKFDLFDANGVAVSSAIAHLSLQKFSGDEPVGDPIDATPTSGADSGNLFRYSGGHYMYNLSTKPFSAGIWRIQATLDDGTVRTIEIGLSSK